MYHVGLQHKDRNWIFLATLCNIDISTLITWNDSLTIKAYCKSSSNRIISIPLPPNLIWLQDFCVLKFLYMAVTDTEPYNLPPYCTPCCDSLSIPNTGLCHRPEACICIVCLSAPVPDSYIEGSPQIHHHCSHYRWAIITTRPILQSGGLQPPWYKYIVTRRSHSIVPPISSCQTGLINEVLSTSSHFDQAYQSQWLAPVAKRMPCKVQTFLSLRRNEHYKYNVQVG